MGGIKGFNRSKLHHADSEKKRPGTSPARFKDAPKPGGMWGSIMGGGLGTKAGARGGAETMRGGVRKYSLFSHTRNVLVARRLNIVGDGNSFEEEEGSGESDDSDMQWD